MEAAKAGVMTQYFHKIIQHLEVLHQEEQHPVRAAARMLADHIKQDRLVYAYGPGGHSNLGSQEIFFRAGGLMHISAILDEGTLLSGGALRSMAMERTPGYGRIVLDDYGLGEGDLLILINAYGINAALIDAALEAKARGVKTIGVTSVRHAKATPPDHPARHPSKQNLYELVDLVLDSRIEVGDAVVEIEGLDQRVAAMSTFANAFLLNSLVAETVDLLVQEGVHPPIWMSGNASGGDAANARFIERFKGRIKKL
ncbi:SIS domain-containing protein [Paenibacillus filicis]|uniref:SIS domain-containing protein n=1 Tax=Paenibacillus gyeongsangnamensis TaxID=3388067 RepID=A0ABT4Q7C4_9BACL|nr:SIS domain-containing protein [Paenibacillus filicis]MCZ8512731.1 SIS domain-containing protein [Paenibacillus filicis]